MQSKDLARNTQRNRVQEENSKQKQLSTIYEESTTASDVLINR